MKELTAEENLKAKEKFDLAIETVRKFLKIMYVFSVTESDSSFKEETLFINEIPIDPTYIKKAVACDITFISALTPMMIGYVVRLEDRDLPEEITRLLNSTIGPDWGAGIAKLVSNIHKTLSNKDGIPCPKLYSFAAYDISSATSIVERDKLPLINASSLIAHDAYNPFVEHPLIDLKSF